MQTRKVAMTRIGTLVVTLLVSVSVILALAPACGDYGCPDGDCSSNTGTAISDGTGDGTTNGTATNTGGELPPNTAPLPCEVFEGAGHECVSAHSSVRVLVPGYTGPLYQVEAPDGTTLDVGTVDGYADVAAQNELCATGGCLIEILYDQSGNGLHMTRAPPGSAKPTPGLPVNADDLPTTINGRPAYGMLFRPGMGYRTNCNDCPHPEGGISGVIPVDDEPESMYMITSQEDTINGCCFNYGNAEVTSNNDGNGTMEAVYFGNGVIWGTGSGSGPWVMADLENGLYPGWENGQDRNISTNTSLLHDYVTAIIVGDTQDKNEGRGRFAIYGGDAQAGELTQMYDGIRPEKPGYVPMQKQGSVILGIGGDNSDGDGGRFYEGVLVTGAASKATVDALQAAIVAAGYGR